MQKLKRDDRWTAGRSLFLLVWVIGLLISQAVSGLLMAVLIASIFETEPFTGDIRALVVISSLAFVPAIFVQVQVVERLLKHSMRGWVLYTLPGIVITWGLYALLQTPFIMDFLENLLRGQLNSFGAVVWRALIASGPALFFQWLWMRNRVAKAWLWPLIAMGLVIAFDLAQNALITNGGMNLYSSFQFPLSVVSLIISGLTMHHVITHPRITEKVKNNITGDMNIDQERTQRLQESDDKAQPWIEESQTHQQAR